MAVALLAGSHELHLILNAFLAELHLRRAEVTEHGEVGLATQHALQLFGHADAAAYHYDVDIVGGAFEEDVADISSYDVALHPEAVGRLTDLVENFLV